MEEAPENGKESPHSVHANGLIDNSNHMFRPNCRAIFRLIFEQVECTIDNALNLQDLVLQEFNQL